MKKMYNKIAYYIAMNIQEKSKIYGTNTLVFIIATTTSYRARF